MVWNYRIISHDTHFGLHEVFYDDDGVPVAYCEAAEVTGETMDEIGQCLKMMNEDYKKGKTKVLTTKDFESRAASRWGREMQKETEWALKHGKQYSSAKEMMDDLLKDKD